MSIIQANLHEKASLTAGTITHDDELTTEFGHLIAEENHDISKRKGQKGAIRKEQIKGSRKR